MLEVRVAKTMKDAIQEYTDKMGMSFYVSLDDICRMQIVPVSATGEKANSTVLSLQKETKTILVRVTFSVLDGVIVRGIYIKDWNEEEN